jgi:Alternative complex III, ActD subunit
MSTKATHPYALLAEFDSPAATMHAAEAIRDAGYKRWDVHTPFPMHGLDKAMGLRNSQVGWFTFIGGTSGFTLAMLMIWWMGKVNYAIPVGGKPLFSPIFSFPIAYELTILLGAFGTLFGMLFLNRLPKLYHPLLKTARFRNVTHDRFYIVIEASDPRFSDTDTRKLLEEVGARHIQLVED